MEGKKGKDFTSLSCSIRNPGFSSIFFPPSSCINSEEKQILNDIKKLKKAIYWEKQKLISIKKIMCYKI